MVVHETPARLTLQQTPGCLRALGYLFLASGALALYGALGGFSNSDELSLLERLGVLAIGCSHLAGGGWVVRGARSVRVVFDRATGQITVVRSGIGRRREGGYVLGDLRAIGLVESRDSDGDPAYMLELVFPEGSEAILALHSHDRQSCEALRRRIAVFLGRDDVA